MSKSNETPSTEGYNQPFFKPGQLVDVAVRCCCYTLLDIKRDQIVERVSYIKSQSGSRLFYIYYINEKPYGEKDLYPSSEKLCLSKCNQNQAKLYKLYEKVWTGNKVVEQPVSRRKKHRTAIPDLFTNI